MTAELAIQSSRRTAIRPWMVTTGLCILFVVFVMLRYGTGIRETLWPTPSGAPGYDGQFSYAIAVDPADAPQFLDVPAYRYQRILHPLLARVLSLGQEPLIPWMMLTINLIALAAGTAAFEKLLVMERVSRWYALVYGLFGGIFFAVRVSTSEPLAFGLVIYAILAGQRSRLNWQAVLLTLAAFAKETTLFFTAGYLLYYFFQQDWRSVIRLILIAVLPYVIWQITLKITLGQFGVGSGGAMATPFEIIPFMGILRFAEFANRGLLPILLLALPLIPLAVIPTLWALSRSVRDITQRRWHPYGFLLLVNAAIIPFVPFSTYREPLGIARFLDGLVICVLLYAALRKAHRALMYSTLWPLFGIRMLG